jgi:hypothetical protein
MKNTLTRILFALLILAWAGATISLSRADALDPAMQAKVDAQIKTIQTWASEPAVISSVKAQNTSLPADYSAMTQDKWKELTKLDPFVRSFDKNPAGEFLKSKKGGAVIRLFLSDATGVKVAFTTKTLSWSHKGDPKHEQPMTGKIWQGPVESDKATGLDQIQVSVPVLDGDKPIGSLVVGLSVSQL